MGRRSSVLTPFRRMENDRIARSWDHGCCRFRGDLVTYGSDEMDLESVD